MGDSARHLRWARRLGKAPGIALGVGDSARCGIAIRPSTKTAATTLVPLTRSKSGPFPNSQPNASGHERPRNAPEGD